MRRTQIALVLILAFGLSSSGCRVIGDLLDRAGFVAVDTTGDGAPDAVMNPVSGRPAPIPQLESPQEMREILTPAVKEAAGAIVRAAKGTQWGQTAETLIGALGGLITAAAGIYYGLRQRKSKRKTEQAAGAVVAAVQKQREANPEFKKALTESINEILATSNVTGADLADFVTARKKELAQ